MKIDYPIINSLLDTDFYKLSMAQVVFFDFPEADTEWEFINRGGTPFPEGFAEELQHQVHLLANLQITEKESLYLLSLPYFKRTFVDFFKRFQFNPCEVKISQSGSVLKVVVQGPWYRNIFWEVPLMAIISELYFLLTDQKPDDLSLTRMGKKALQLALAGCEWSDFGTRRRFSFDIQDQLIMTMNHYSNDSGFLGTSNPYFAMKYKLPVIGTSAHEAQMAMSAKYGVQNANRMWLKHWSDFYRGQLGIALTDTYTTDVFLRDFDGYNARLFDGVRHDSGDPIGWTRKMVEFYKNMGIQSKTKRFVYSDGLTVGKYINIHSTVKDVCRPVAGIGTHFTNNVGVIPLNIVIKMTKANFGFGWKDVVKLSDNTGKHTGNIEAIEQVKKELGLI